MIAHEDSLASLREESGRLMDQEKGSDVGKLRRRMEDLTAEWDLLREKASNRQCQLEDARREVSFGLYFNKSENLFYLNVLNF